MRLMLIAVAAGVAGCTPADPLECVSGWEVASEGEYPQTFATLPPVAVDPGLWVSVMDAGATERWQLIGWNGAPGPVVGVPTKAAGTQWQGASEGQGGALLVTQVSADAVRVVAIKPDAGVTTYAALDEADVTFGLPHSTGDGVLLTLQQRDGGWSFALSNETSATRLALATPGAPRAVVTTGAGLLLASVEGSRLLLTPLSFDGAPTGSTVEVEHQQNGSLQLVWCGGAEVAAVVETYGSAKPESFGARVLWLNDEGHRVGPSTDLGDDAIMPTLVCARGKAVVVWTVNIAATGNSPATTELRLAEVSKTGTVTRWPLALEQPAETTGNWYSVVRKSGAGLGLSWLRYSEALGYQTKFASLRCKR